MAKSDPLQHDEDHEQLRRLDSTILRGSIWTAVGFGGGQVVTFASMLVLVRLVEPRAFGLVALASPFLIALQFLQESGLSSALIHRRTEVDRAAATVMLFSPLAGASLYVVSFFAAPLAARLVHEHDLTTVLRVLSLMLLIRSVAIVPSSLLEREMRFGARARVDLVAVVAQFAAAISLAVTGFGVWALVFGQIAAEAARSIAYWVLRPARPHPREASIPMLRELARYGRFISANNILNVVNTTADNLIVGRLLGSTQLGFYALSFRLAILPNSVIGYVVGRVMFSVYASLQEDIAATRRVYLQNLQRIAVFALPVSCVLIVAARPIVLALLGQRWAPAVGPLRLLAVYGLVRSFVAPSGELFKGLGRPSLGLVFSVLYALPVIPALLLLVPAVGLEGAPLALMVGQLVASVPMFVTSMRLLHVGVDELGAALAPLGAAAAVLTGVLLAAVELTRSAPAGISLVLVLAAGLAAYVAACAAFARGVVVPMWANLRAPQT